MSKKELVLNIARQLYFSLMRPFAIECNAILRAVIPRDVASRIDISHGNKPGVHKAVVHLSPEPIHLISKTQIKCPNRQSYFSLFEEGDFAS